MPIAYSCKPIVSRSFILAILSKIQEKLSMEKINNAFNKSVDHL